MLFFYRKIAKLLSENDYDKVILEVNGSLFLTLKMKHNDKNIRAGTITICIVKPGEHTAVRILSQPVKSDLCQ